MAVEHSSDANAARLSMGPVLFNWSPENWRDFYFRLADEAPVDTVYLGEVVCSKRAPFTKPVEQEVIERLQTAGKQVVYSTLALVMNKADRALVREAISSHQEQIEINDISALAQLHERGFYVGPLINCYNELALAWFAEKGARRVCLPVELSLEAVGPIVKAANAADVETEVFAFGRMPLAVSARCYHARVHKLTKDSCRFICDQDPDGLDVHTLDDEDFLVINGIQSMSHGFLNFLNDLDMLKSAGINSFRLSPHSFDMVKVSDIFRQTLDGALAADEASAKLAETCGGVPFSNGYLHDEAGVKWTA